MGMKKAPPQQGRMNVGLEVAAARAAHRGQLDRDVEVDALVPATLGVARHRPSLARQRDFVV